MQSVFDLSTAELIRGFNFISKVCAAELDEITINPTDRIITSANDGEYFWEKVKRVSNSDKAMGILDAGYKRMYRLHFGKKDEFNEIDIRIYISNLESENNRYVSFLREVKFTKDQVASINMVIPDLSIMTESETISKNMKVFKTIYNIFRCFLNANHDPLICGCGTLITDINFPMAESANNYIKDLSRIFTLLTGLFPEGFVPDHEMSDRLIKIAETMYQDRTLIDRAREGHIIIMGVNCFKLLEYMERIGGE